MAQRTQSWCQTAGGWGLFLTQLPVESRMSQRLCWLTSGQGQGPVSPRAGTSLLTGDVRRITVGYGAAMFQTGVHLLMSEAILEAKTALWWGYSRGSGTDTCPLLGGEQSESHWLQGPGNPRSSTCTLVLGPVPGPFGTQEHVQGWLWAQGLLGLVGEAVFPPI